MSQKRYLIRELYLRRLRDNRDDHDFVKVITGIRRSGKTVLMDLFIRDLTISGVKHDDIIVTRMASREMMDYQDPKRYLDYVYSKIAADANTYLFIDEIQNISEWEKVIDAIMVDRPLCDLYVTGSNAFLLSGELATYLTGRYVEIHVLPLSFSEYCALNEPVPDINLLFNRYLRNGSFPAIDASWDDQMVMDHLEGLYNTILVKDVMERSNRSISVFRLKRITEYLLESTGRLVSVNNIANKVKVSNDTVESYLQLLVDSFVVYPVYGYDIKGKSILNRPSKYYCNDLGIRNYALGFRNGDLGSQLETIVYLELKRRGYQVYVGCSVSSEVDFVARKGTKTEYYQVTESYRDPKVSEREFAPLMAIHDNYPKYVVTGDVINEPDRNGIQIVNIITWLTEGQTAGAVTDSL